MTAKKGTLWKTSWNRGRGTPNPDSVGNMAFFINFFGDFGVARYQSAALSTLGTSLPFWFAAVGSGVGGTFRAGSISAGWDATVDGDVSPFEASFIAKVAPTFGNIHDEMIVPGATFVEAVIVEVSAHGTGYRVRAFFENQQYQVVYSDAAYVPMSGSVPIQLFPAESGAFHGGCGGNSALTGDEMRQWFLDLKSNLEIQPIPGKTTHLFTATSVFPLVPATLPNGAGAQNLDYTVVSDQPVPTNVLVPVRFNW